MRRKCTDWQRTCNLITRFIRDDSACANLVVIEIFLHEKDNLGELLEENTVGGKIGQRKFDAELTIVEEIHR